MSLRPPHQLHFCAAGQHPQHVASALVSGARSRISTVDLIVKTSETDLRLDRVNYGSPRNHSCERGETASSARRCEEQQYGGLDIQLKQTNRSQAT